MLSARLKKSAQLSNNRYVKRTQRYTDSGWAPEGQEIVGWCSYVFWSLDGCCEMVIQNSKSLFHVVALSRKRLSKMTQKIFVFFLWGENNSNQWNVWSRLKTTKCLSLLVRTIKASSIPHSVNSLILLKIQVTVISFAAIYKSFWTETSRT